MESPHINYVRAPRAPKAPEICLPRAVGAYDVPPAIRDRPYMKGSAKNQLCRLKYETCSMTDYQEHQHTMLYYEEALCGMDKALTTLNPGPNRAWHAWMAVSNIPLSHLSSTLHKASVL